MLNGLTRPDGPVKIRRTELRGNDVLVANLGGAVRTEVAAVKHGRKYFFVAPEHLGGVQEVPADSLTDCLHFSVWKLGRELSGRRKTGRRS